MVRALVIVYAIAGLLCRSYGQVSNIVAGEYFFETDPGVGAATPIPAFTAKQSVDLSFLASTAGATKGIQMLGIRLRDDNNVWSMTSYFPVYVMASEPVVTEKISAAEYFFDDDPGTGSATAITVGTAAPMVDVSFAANSSGLSPGMHMFATRARNIYGQWGLPTFMPIYIEGNGSLTKLEYFFDSDPGVGNATPIPVGQSTNVFDEEVTLNSAALASGVHTLSVRAGGFWGIAESVTFTVCETGTPLAVSDVVCIGSPTTFKDKSKTLVGDLYAWDFDSDGSVDAKSDGDQTFTYSAAGTHTATLSIDRSGCVLAVSIDVTVDNVPTAAAGSDQSICGNAIATLEGDAGGAVKFSWSTSGDGKFNDPGILKPEYSPGTDDVSKGMVQLVLTVDPSGACLPASDEITISVTKNIEIVSHALDVSINNPEDLSLQTGGTFNAGDVLTATVTSAPNKGVASLKAGTILEYMASNGTVGKDSVHVRVCNQCNQCDEEFIFFTVRNEAPTAFVPPANTAPGSVLMIDLSSGILDPNNNLGSTPISIIEPPASGASAQIDENLKLSVDYTNVIFSGTDHLKLEICDDLGVCIQYTITIEVQPLSTAVNVYNAVAPNSTGDNRFMRIINIPLGTKVSIYNRWGDKVFQVESYDNDVSGQRFEGMNESGKALPSGIYFYRVETPAHKSPLTGYLSLKQ